MCFENLTWRATALAASFIFFACSENNTGSSGDSSTDEEQMEETESDTSAASEPMGPLLGGCTSADECEPGQICLQTLGGLAAECADPCEDDGECGDGRICGAEAAIPGQREGAER